MGRVLRRILLLIAVFLFGVTGTALLLNSASTDNRSDMNSAVLPEVMVKLGDTYMNRMYGYTGVMQADFTRQSVTPLDTTKKLVFAVNPYETAVNSLSYEIRTSDGSKVIENRKIKNLAQGEKYLEAEVQIESNLRMNQEYSMQISLDTGVGTVYYYTRVISRSVLYTEEYVKFARDFAEQCLDMTTAENLGKYLESANASTTTNFSHITIQSSLSQISWGSLHPTMVETGVPIIKDINETTASLSLEYQISAEASDGVVDYFNVTEFYRLRHTDTRIMLLDFERSADQVFLPRASRISSAGLLLGIRDKNVSYMLNEDISIAAFSQAGDLWTYAMKDGKFVRVFSFRNPEEDRDYRDARDEHDIKIIRVDENGDVDFVLSGYMNRGEHEGKCGVCVYHYNSDQNVVEEKVFIPSTESHEFLKQDLGTLSYVNQDNQLFLLFAGRLYQVNIDENSYEILEENINNERFAVSATNAHAAWQVMTGDDSGKIKEIDFDSRKTTLRSPEEGGQLRVLGFMNEDLIYGQLYVEDVIKDSNGHVTEGLHSFRIEDFEGNLKKEYKKDGLYIVDVSVAGTMMEFQLAKKQDTGYTVTQKDNIMNNKKAAENSVAIELTSSASTGTMVRLAFEESPGASEALTLYAKLRNQENTEIALDTQVPERELYYVYGYGGLDRIYVSTAAAVRRADTLKGVVLNRAQQYVWERGNKKEQIQLNAEDVPEIFKTGVWEKELLQEGMENAGTVIDLSGCTLDSVLYEISAQRAVVAKTGKDTSVVIVGYDEYNTYLYDPKTKETYPYGMNDSTELFEKAGNIFLSYIEPPTT
ncbi:MAG: hypothetical protein Q4B26_01735 [Eubacteriales bacterium]|nr:hypothetical protein [Eubacteriales bacterium]